MEANEIAFHKDYAREAAAEDIAKYGKGKRRRIFHDGLGALGVGMSLQQPSPAGVRQAEYDRIMFDLDEQTSLFEADLCLEMEQEIRRFKPFRP